MLTSHYAHCAWRMARGLVDTRPWWRAASADLHSWQYCRSQEPTSVVLQSRVLPGCNPPAGTGCASTEGFGCSGQPVRFGHCLAPGAFKCVGLQHLFTSLISIVIGQWTHCVSDNHSSAPLVLCTAPSQSLYKYRDWASSASSISFCPSSSVFTPLPAGSHEDPFLPHCCSLLPLPGYSR